MNYRVDTSTRCIVCRTLNPGARCRGCGRTQAVAQSAPSPKRVVVDGLVYDWDKVPVGVSGGTVAAVSTSSAAQARCMSVPTAPLAETAVGGVQPSEAHSELDVPRETICACGWTVPAESKAPKTAMAAHRSHSKLHKVST